MQDGATAVWLAVALRKYMISLCSTLTTDCMQQDSCYFTGALFWKSYAAGHTDFYARITARLAILSDPLALSAMTLHSFAISDHPRRQMPQERLIRRC